MLAKKLLFIAAFTQFFDASRNIAAGILRGYGDTKSSLWTGFFSCWLVGIPLSVLFGFLLHLGALGIRLGIMVGISLGSFHLMYRLYSFIAANTV